MQIWAQLNPTEQAKLLSRPALVDSQALRDTLILLST